MKIYPISKSNYLNWRNAAKTAYRDLSATIRIVKRNRVDSSDELMRRMAQSAAAELGAEATRFMERLAWLKACARLSVAQQRCSEAPPY